MNEIDWNAQPFDELLEQLMRAATREGLRVEVTVRPVSEAQQFPVFYPEEQSQQNQKVEAWY